MENSIPGPPILPRCLRAIALNRHPLGTDLDVTSGCDGVANLWTEFAALHGYEMATNGKEWRNPSNSLMAATFEKAKTYVFAETRFGAERSKVRIHSLPAIFKRL